MVEPHTMKWLSVSLTPDAFYGEGAHVARYFLVYFKESGIGHFDVAYWNCDLPFNGHPTGWDFDGWKDITHWMPLPEEPS